MSKFNGNVSPDQILQAVYARMDFDQLCETKEKLEQQLRLINDLIDHRSEVQCDA